jgi:UMF1 family MFS transporter
MTIKEARRGKLATFSWALWDWAEQPYPTIIQTFIFATYITSSYFGDPDQNTQALSTAMIISGVLVALISPVFGRRADEAGRRKFWLLVQSGILIAIMAASYFVEPRPEFLIFGLALYGLGSVVQETAFINYYAMLKQVTKEHNIGKISGYAWALGYVGGILLLMFSLVGFYLPDTPWFGVSTNNAENLRVMFLFSAIWMLVFTIPLAIFVPEVKANPNRKKENIFGAYLALWSQLKSLQAQAPETLKFLIIAMDLRAYLVLERCLEP